VTQDDKTIEDLERDRRQDKKVDRRDAAGVVREKRPPALRWWPPKAAHIVSDRRLGHLETELEQLTMNAWRALQRVRTAHLANELAQLGRDLRSGNTIAGPPAPIRPKPGAVPANDRLWPDNRNGAQGVQGNQRYSQTTEIDRYCSTAVASAPVGEAR